MNKNDLNEKWLRFKPKVIVLVCLIGAFISGYATASIEPTPRQLNYTSNNSPAPTKPIEQKANFNVEQGSDCPVKGSSSHIYHVQGGAFYDRTTAVICFQTEAEALAAGYRKSSR